METSFPLAYLAALAAVYLTPGPDMALVMATSAASGFRAGLVSSAGIAAARFLHVMVSGFGLAAVLSAHPALFQAVRAGGAAYLLWLAWKLWRSHPGGEGAAGRDPSPGGTLLRGFLTNLLNPKALLFCAMLLPQFVSPDKGPLLSQFAWLGALLVGTGWLFDCAYALGASGLARRVHASRGRAGQRALGLVFAALALRLAAG